MPPRRTLLLSLALLPLAGVGFCSWFARASAAVTSPAPAEITAAIRQLDDDSYVRREEATQSLWEAGRAAEPALQHAAVHGDPEVRARAQRVLEKFRYGIYPDTPPEIADLVSRYHTADTNAKFSIIGMLGDKGGYGIIVLARMEAEENDVQLQENIRTVLKARVGKASETASILMAGNDFTTAERMLDEAAVVSGDETATRAYAAFLLVTGKLPARLAALEDLAAAGPNPKLAKRLAVLYRAQGDLTAALAWAAQASDPKLQENLLLERRDWPGLAKAMVANGDAPEDIRHNALIAAVQRFAGDETGFAASLARLRTLSKRTDTQGQAVMAFLLNDQVGDALAIQLDRKAYLNAFEIYRYTGRFTDAIAVCDRATSENHPDAFKLQANTARLLWRLGEKSKADALLTAVAAQLEKTNEVGLAGMLCEADRECGRADAARQVIATALATPAGAENHPWLLAKLFPEKAVVAAAWWEFLQTRPSGKRGVELLDQVAALLNRQLPADEVEAMAAEAAGAAAAGTDKTVRARWLPLLVEALRGTGRNKAADVYLDQLAALQEEAGDWAHVGAFYRDKKDWLHAADAYKRAAFHPADFPDCLWLEGYCLQAGGKEREGNAVMAEARSLPLADERHRHALAEAMSSCGLRDEVREQYELLLRTGPSRGWYFYESAKQLGNDAARRGDYLQASEYWRLFLLQVLDDGGAFLDETAYLDLPQLVHRNRARGLLAHGDVAAAMTELRAYLAVAPASEQLAIDFVPELDKAGHTAEADELFGLVKTGLTTAYRDFARSSYFHNDLAWACTLCNREPELALAHALAAVELAPMDTNCLDTLAETHFRAGRLAEAEKVMRQCIALEPDQDRHRKRLEGFKAGKGFSKD